MFKDNFHPCWKLVLSLMYLCPGGLSVHGSRAGARARFGFGCGWLLCTVLEAVTESARGLGVTMQVLGRRRKNMLVLAVKFWLLIVPSPSPLYIRSVKKVSYTQDYPLSALF